MIFSSRDDLTRTLADTYAACPYYQGTGTCFGGGCSAAGEPLCITNEPLDGWASETFEPYNEPNTLLVTFRTIWKGHPGTIQGYLAGITGAVAEDDEPQLIARVEHARRVLSRLATLTEGGA